MVTESLAVLQDNGNMGMVMQACWYDCLLLAAGLLAGLLAGMVGTMSWRL